MGFETLFIINTQISVAYKRIDIITFTNSWQGAW